MAETTFIHMVCYGKTYRPAEEAAKEALTAGDSHAQVIEELAFLIAVVCDDSGTDISKAHAVIDRVAKAQPSAQMLQSLEAAEA